MQKRNKCTRTKPAAAGTKIKGENTMQSTEIANEYRNIPLTQLQESPTNPRRRFNEETLKELAASFVTQGILAPLVVRPTGEEQFEVVAGARRFRAAKIAGL